MIQHTLTMPADLYASTEASRVRQHVRLLRGGNAQSFLTQFERERLAQIAQKLHRDNSLARVPIETLAALSVGDATNVESRSGDKAFRAAASDEWRRFTESADAAGESSYQELLAEGVRAWPTDGDFGFLRVERGSPRVQLIEAALLRNPGGNRDTPTQVGGKELEEPGGRPVAYHLAEWAADGGYATSRTRRIDAGLIDWCVNPRFRRLNQRRGEPGVQAAAERVALIEEIHVAVMIACRMGASPGLVRFKNPETPGLREEFSQLADTSALAEVDASDQQTTLESGEIWDLLTTERVEQVKPEHPHVALVEFLWMQIGLLCADLGIAPSVAFHRHIRNFHASRTDWMQTWKLAIRPVQACLEHRAIRPHYRWVVSRAIATGRLPLVPDWDACDVFHPQMPLLDPAQESNASAKEIERNLSTLERELRKRGVTDVERHLRQIAEERRLMDALGIERVVTPGAMPQTVMPETNEPESENDA